MGPIVTDPFVTYPNASSDTVLLGGQVRQHAPVTASCHAWRRRLRCVNECRRHGHLRRLHQCGTQSHPVPSTAARAAAWRPTRSHVWVAAVLRAQWGRKLPTTHTPRPIDDTRHRIAPCDRSHGAVRFTAAAGRLARGPASAAMSLGDARARARRRQRKTTRCGSCGDLDQFCIEVSEPCIHWLRRAPMRMRRAGAWGSVPSHTRTGRNPSVIAVALSIHELANDSYRIVDNSGIFTRSQDGCRRRRGCGRSWRRDPEVVFDIHRNHHTEPLGSRRRPLLRAPHARLAAAGLAEGDCAAAFWPRAEWTPRPRQARPMGRAHLGRNRARRLQAWNGCCETHRLSRAPSTSS